jgi:hypothetical protein
MPWALADSAWIRNAVERRAIATRGVVRGLGMVLRCDV